MVLLDPELLLDFELLLLAESLELVSPLPDVGLLPFSELLELELVSPLDVDALELLLVPLLAAPAPAVSDDELSPALDACTSSSTLITALLTWPDGLDPVALELDGLAVLAVEFDGVLAAADACVVSVADVLLARLVLSSAKRALAALDELAPVTDICCSLETIYMNGYIFQTCLNRIIKLLKEPSRWWAPPAAVRIG